MRFRESLNFGVSGREFFRKRETEREPSFPFFIFFDSLLCAKVGVTRM